MPELAFFVGKGGVGKTTVSAAYAVRVAAKIRSANVLLVSSDPAHSIADLFERKLPSRKTRIPVSAGRKIAVWELDSDALFREFLGEHRRKLVRMIEGGTLFSAAEISSLLETTLPGMSEIAALLAIQDAIESGRYTHIVVDTAPFGHTLRLFSLPDQFVRLINFLELSADRDRVLAQHFGGKLRRPGTEFIDLWREKIARLKGAFAKASLFLVTTAERFALNESLRCMRQMGQSALPLSPFTVVLNRVVVRDEGCTSCRKRAAEARAAGMELRKAFGAEILTGQDPGAPILGIDSLRKFGNHVFDGKALKLRPAPRARKVTQIRLSPAPWPIVSGSLSFVLGKGGVGKTTVAAGLGLVTRERSSDPVDLCSVDPAPSLDDVFKTGVGDQPVPVLGDSKFRASEFDSLALFKNWVGEIREEVEAATTTQGSGIHIDLSYERALLSELLELVPPGLDEILAIFRIVELTRNPANKVIIDMAPTGHALELLRMPERVLGWTRLLLKSLAAHRKLALAREAAVKIAELEVRARELVAAFKSSSTVQTFAVMLPEALPDRETARLLMALEKLGLAPQAIFVNRVIQPGQRKLRCKLCQEAWRGQQSVMATLRRRLRGARVFVIADFDQEISGRRGLQKLTSELWQLN